MFFITFLNERRDALKELVRCLYEWKVAHALQRKESENARVQSSAAACLGTIRSCGARPIAEQGLYPDGQTAGRLAFRVAVARPMLPGQARRLHRRAWRVSRGL
jgi:hypothetical protein